MELIIFDFDGTLIDTRQDIIAAVNYARHHFQLPALDGDAITQMVGHGTGVLATRAFQRTPIEASEAENVIMDYYLSHPGDYASVYPGVRETLPRLQVIRAIVSNKPVSLIEVLLEKISLASLFDFVAGGDTFPERKPAPTAIDFLLRRYQIPRTEALMVGDHSPDIEMAKQAGIQSVYCNYGFFGEDTVGADFSIDCFSELLEVWNRI